MIPGWRDPRWVSVTILGTFTVLGQTVLPFGVRPLEVACAVGTATALDLVAGRLRNGRWQVPLSATVTGLSLGVLLRSVHPAVFVVAAVAAIGSKHLLRSRDGGHVFNPSAFGLIVALAASGGMASVTEPAEWGRSGLVALLICGFATVVLTRTRRLAMCATYLAAHAPTAPLTLAGAFGPSTLVFACFMLTDPRTAPRQLRPSLAYAVAVAALGAALDAGGSMVGPYLALVAVCAAVPWLVRRTAAQPAPLPA